MFKCFKKSFLIRFYIENFIHSITKILYFINIIIPKKDNLIVAFIDYENVNGKTIPYFNDNVYMTVDYIQKQKNNIEVVQIPHNQFGGRRNLSVPVKDILFFIWSLFRAKIILQKHPFRNSYMFTKKQHIMAMGYFIPFKADYLDMPKWWVFYSDILGKDFDLEKCKENQLMIEYMSYKDKMFKNMSFIVPSKYCADVLSKSHSLPRDSFQILGSPKSELVAKKQIDIKDIFNIKNDFSKVVLYTPTFRDDFMRKDIEEIDEKELNIFGYNDETNELESFLIKNKIVIIVKLHKSAKIYRDLENKLIKKDKSYFENCYFLDFEIEAKFSLSVYDLFGESDAMIADYSSISFDYLPYDKPILFNIPDIKKYRLYRGFSYEPIEDMMPGDKIKTIDELKEALINIDKDKYSKERMRVLSKVNEVENGKSLPNIYNHIEGIITQ